MNAAMMDRLTHERTSMGLFDLFKKSSEAAAPEALVVSDYTAKTIYAPASGKVVALENVPDPVFAGGMLGQGLGIWPLRALCTRQSRALLPQLLQLFTHLESLPILEKRS